MKLRATASFHKLADNQRGCKRIAADVPERRTDSTPTVKLDRRTLDRVCFD